MDYRGEELVIPVVCDVGECDRRVHARRLCEMHYRRLTRRNYIGEAAPQKKPTRFAIDPLKQFVKNVEILPDGCWLWAGACTTAGYGEIQVAGCTVYAHRWALEMAYGPIPEGLHVDHICHNVDKLCPGGNRCEHRRCVNPMHLEAVTVAENNRRMRNRLS